MKYLAIMENGESDNNITFEAETFNEAQRYLYKQIKRGTFHTIVKLVELDSMKSKKFSFHRV